MNLATPTISDAMDMLGLPGQVLGVRALVPGTTCSGPAFTVRFAPVSETLDGAAADYLEQVPPGSVVVLDNDGRVDCTVWGDLLTRYAQMRNVAGTVVWGAARDIATCTELGYPLFAAASWMRSGKGRVALAEVGGPVVVAGVSVNPGDVIVADGDGVLCINALNWRRVREAALLVERTEAAIRADLAAGRTLAVARQSRGYHALRLPRAGTRE